ncbi:transcription termination/antitermination protein NusA [Ancylothrix sp. C2]|uniref:transcription termination/antitermination protein NusA n=1 Tax=Ancylothrix sp. D3o TaxID=2953691 RepID=UPI0021BB3EAB|nr:transcription termination/antitermination protein NusA [Ancylothrix sp. D3o]MCT7950417.1 transcription termination/antitermination protein NusA [Ancylothrix sp. D3o]
MSMVKLPGLKTIIESLSRERSLPESAVQNALKEALKSGYERYRRTQVTENPNFTEDYFDNFNVQLDLVGEGYRILATKTVVEEVVEPDKEVALKTLSKIAIRAKIGDTIMVDVTPLQGDFGRLAALQTKQVLTQKLQEQQLKIVQELFQPLRGTVLDGKVHRIDRKAAIFALNAGVGNPEVYAELPNYEKLHQDNYVMGATMKVYLKKVYDTPRQGPPLRVSRATTGLVSGMLTSLVPEIQQQIIEITNIVRDSTPAKPEIPSRTKIAVNTQQDDIDPVSICEGENSGNIAVISKELGGEKIEILLWSEDPCVYIKNALMPATVQEVIILDAEKQQAQVTLTPDQLPLALGLDEQNVKLASRLTGWRIDLITGE